MAHIKVEEGVPGIRSLVMFFRKQVVSPLPISPGFIKRRIIQLLAERELIAAMSPIDNGVL